MKTTISILLTSIAFAASAYGQSTILWNESVNGSLSENPSNPTQLGILAMGTNTMLGATQIEPTGNNWLVHEDIFTLNVPNGASLAAVFITVDKPKVGSWIGDTGYSSQLGYVADSENGNLLAQWGVVTLGVGSYGMYLGNYDPQPFTSVASYRLDFVVQSVPEPSVLWLLVGGLGLVGIQRWRRSKLPTQ